MIKLRIFKYEMKRLILSKAYIFLLILVCAYSLYILKAGILPGFANTAPFSEWSFMNYLFIIAPFLSIILLFYVSRLFSPYEKNVMRITSSMPFSGPMYFFIKLAVITLAYIFAAFMAIIACFIFYGTVFEFYDFKIFAVCIALVLIPQMLFLQGIGIWLGKIRHTLAIVLIALIFFTASIDVSLPYYFDIMGETVMQIPQGAIPHNGVISFDIPLSFSISRIILCALGMLLIFTGCKRYSRRM